ncbi:heme ABC transporter ATP-binding protein [Serratia microhaemolytica]|uniref:heme ABC transporter ATP-binding protein n=1 Tax=Serratia microhaemolytica TaxID=2675110 RepID=UPI000FDE34AA|nr:heme ABC transporter ATP-binding protein [Serratia microhaemolytica]
MAITLQSAQLSLSGKTVLNNLSVSFASGCLTVILGPNGTGKSSLLKVLSGELRCAGELSFYGKLRQHWSAPELAKSLAVLPQASSLNFNFTVREVVELGGMTLNASHDQIKKIAADNMAQLAITSLAERLLPQLSGGEQQRVHLARILTQVAQSPRAPMLLLDEPTSALDIAHQQQTLMLLKELTQRGVGVIAVLHDLNLATHYADRMIILHQGEIAADGKPAVVLSPELIEGIYHYPVQIISHPLHGYPLVVSG